MRKKMQWQWESLDECTHRAAVIGGWLLLHTKNVIVRGKEKSELQTESMTFVPDRDHEWHIIPAQKEVEAAKPTVKAADFEPK